MVMRFTRIWQRPPTSNELKGLIEEALLVVGVHGDGTPLAVDAADHEAEGGHPKIGADLLKKIIVYTLLMKRSVPVDRLFELLMATHWYKETVDLYFGGAYRARYDEIIDAFIRRRVIHSHRGCYTTTVPP